MELADVVEQGKVQLFDCAPILYSPPADPAIANDPSRATRGRFTMPTELIKRQNMDSEGREAEDCNARKKPGVFAHIASMNSKQLQVAREATKQRMKNDIIDKNV